MTTTNIFKPYPIVRSVRIIRMAVLLSVCITACKKFVTVPPPPTVLTSDIVFTSDQTATAALLSVYIDMMNDQNGSNGSFVCFSMSALGGFSGNELQWTQSNTTAPIYQEFTTHALTPGNTYVAAFWRDGYKYIYRVNAILEGIAASTGMTAAGKTAIEGEAKFIRAFCYFHLVNIFGDVPLVLNTNYQASMVLPRTPVAKVWSQINSDLADAKQMLPVNYPTTERLRPNQKVASALLARAYLYQGRWQEAEAQADSIITSGAYGTKLPALNLVFLKGSTETIWQLQPVRSNMNTNEGSAFYQPSTTAQSNYAITPNLLAAFEKNDQRKVQWVGFNDTVNHPTWAYPAKYKAGAITNSTSPTEYYIVFRLTEQYMIRSEACAHQGGSKLATAISDLNVIRQRAGLPSINPADQASLLLAIEQERQVEFFAEWGHRWFDLKRTNRAQTVLKPLSPTNTWKPGSELYPVPDVELYSNPYLVQNPGY